MVSYQVKQRPLQHFRHGRRFHALCSVCFFSSSFSLFHFLFCLFFLPFGRLNTLCLSFQMEEDKGSVCSEYDSAQSRNRGEDNWHLLAASPPPALGVSPYPPLGSSNRPLCCVVVLLLGGPPSIISAPHPSLEEDGSLVLLHCQYPPSSLSPWG